MSDQVFKLRVVTKTNTYYIDEMSELEQEYSLIMFYIDGNIQLVIPTDEFLWCEKIELDNTEYQRRIAALLKEPK